MKIWVDDIRTPPDDTWRWVKTSDEAILLLSNHLKLVVDYDLDVEVIEIMSLDHDLGGEDTTRPIVLWCCGSNWWPIEVVVHSANPVGREWLEGMIERYKNAD